MSTPNLDLDKLRAVSKELHDAYTSKCRRNEDLLMALRRAYTTRGDFYYIILDSDIDTIAADLLRLAGRVEELEDFCENEVLAVRGVQMDYKKGAELYERLKIKSETPASAGKPKTKEE